MSGRNRASRYIEDYGPRGFRDGPRSVMIHGSRPLPPPYPTMLEDELELKLEEMRRIASENRHLAEDHRNLGREIAAAKEEIHRLGQTIPQLRADKELHVRELIQNGLKLESELRDAEPLKSEVVQLSAESEKLKVLRQELSAKVQGLAKELTRLQAENKQLPVMREQMDALHQELRRAREAFEYEKKANMEQKEHKQLMENNILSLTREFEKLRAEHSANLRVQGLGAYGGLTGSSEIGYTSGMLKGSSEIGFTNTAFGDGYGGAWGGVYDRHGRLPRH